MQGRCVYSFQETGQKINRQSASELGGEEFVGSGAAAGKRQAAAEPNEHYFLSGEALVASVGGEGVVDRWASRSVAKKERGGGGRQRGGLHRQRAAW